jgi:hypothetical protein
MCDDRGERGPDREQGDAAPTPGLVETGELHEQVNAIDGAVTDICQDRRKNICSIASTVSCRFDAGQPAAT